MKPHLQRLANIGMRMIIIKCLQHAQSVRQARKDNHDVQDLMARTEDVKAARMPFLGELPGTCVSGALRHEMTRTACI